jgi:signal peptidase I
LVTLGPDGTTSENRDSDNVTRVTPAVVSPQPDDTDSGGSTAKHAAPPKKARPMWLETVMLVVTAVVLALLIKTFFIQAFYIPSGSMRDTLRVNDRILVEKMSYWFGDIQRGDIVVFDDPDNWLGEEGGDIPGNALTKTLSVVGLYPTGGHLVKRVIGVGGDTVACRGGLVRVDGVPLHESSYVTLAQRACDGSWSVVVPADHLWVLGDNRENSADSRAHTGDPGGGYIPDSDVVGKVFVVVWPLDHFTFLNRPGTFDNPRLDQAAAIITDTTPIGLALVGVPLLAGRRRRARARS